MLDVMGFPGDYVDFTSSVGMFCDKGEVDEWYYRVNDEQIQEESHEDTFLCWKKNRYVEKKVADTNLVKLPLVRINGNIRKITLRELAYLKGFPKEVKIETGNKRGCTGSLSIPPM